MVNNIGVFGGTFDPIHKGHILVVEHLVKFLNLDYIIIVPCGVPPHKRRLLASPKQRCEMVRLATCNNPQVILSTIEAEKENVSYTIDTIEEIKKEYPCNNLFFIIGADNVKEISTWKDYNKLLKMCNFVAISRPGYSLDKEKFSYSNHIKLINFPTLDISSSHIRECMVLGEPIDDFVPSSVREYIRENGLYIPEFNCV